MTNPIVNMIRQCLMAFLLVFGVSGQLENDINDVVNDYSDEFPMDCVTREYTFQASVIDDANRKCEGNITTVACYGSCDTWEYGIEEFPYRKTKSEQCMHGETKERVVTLTNCEQGAMNNKFRYIEAVTCLCQSCKPDKADCRSRTGKKRNQGVIIDEDPVRNFVTKNRKKPTKLKKDTQQIYF